MAVANSATTALLVVGAAAALLAVAVVLVVVRSRRQAREDQRRLDEITRQLVHARTEARRNRLLADLDGLTGLHNRRYFHEMLAREVARAQRYGRELALMIFDLDDFKSINDRIGHL